MSTRNREILKKFDELHERIGSDEFFGIYHSLKEGHVGLTTISDFIDHFNELSEINGSASYFELYFKNTIDETLDFLRSGEPLHSTFEVCVNDEEFEIAVAA